jgi:hypothetical protein
MLSYAPLRPFVFKQTCLRLLVLNLITANKNTKYDPRASVIVQLQL